jgi:hypothetical protein
VRFDVFTTAVRRFCPWDLITCSPIAFYSVLEEVTASIFLVEEKAKKAPRTQETQAAESSKRL